MLLRKLRTHMSFANVTSLMALFIALGGVSWAAVTLPKNSVGASQIKKDAVSTSEVKKNAISNSELKDGAINSIEIRDGGVGNADVANNAITNGKIADGSVLLADLAANSVDGSKVVDESLGGGDVTDGSINGADITDGGVQAGDVQGGTFLGGKVTVQFEEATVALADGAAGVSYDVHCPAGQIALGGGSRGDATDSEYTVTHSSRPIISTTSPSAPVDNGTFTGWRTTVTNPVGDLPQQDASAPGPADGPILPQVWVICAAVGP